MKDVLVSLLRDKSTDIASWRRAAHQLSHLLAFEAHSLLAKKPVSLSTPLAKAKGSKLKSNVVLVPILRSGIAMLESFMEVFEGSKVGFVGLKRDEKTAIASLYYENLPEISKSDDVIVLDPMLATGGSLCDALKAIRKTGVIESKIIYVGIISSKQGVQRVKKEFPKVRIVMAQTDQELNKKKFIVPGLGDFGDRYFGTI